MFGSIGGPELVVIFLVALLVFGPRKLPELGKMLGKSLGEFRRAANDLRVSLETEVAREASTRPLPLPLPLPPEPLPSTAPGDADPAALPAASAETPLMPTTAPGSVARPRPFPPALAEVAAAAEPTDDASPAAPEPDGRELERTR